MIYNSKMGLKISCSTKKALKRVLGFAEDSFWNYLCNFNNLKCLLEFMNLNPCAIC